MKSLLYVGGPLIATICFGFWSGLLDFAHNIEGFEHAAGVEQGGTFALEHQETYQCDENGNNCVLVDEKTEFSEIDGLEIEEQPIEYRDGMSAEYNKTKQPGLPKYANIVMRRPTGFDWRTLRFEFERQTEIEAVNDKYDQKIKEAQSNEGEVEMIEIDPPVLVIPAN